MLRAFNSSLACLVLALVVCASALAQVPPPSGYNRIEDETTALTRRQTLRFEGATVTCVDDGAFSRTVCTVTAPPAGASLALDNLAAVSINAHLTPQADRDLGSASSRWKSLYMGGSTVNSAGTTTAGFDYDRTLTSFAAASRMLSLKNTNVELFGVKPTGEVVLRTTGAQDIGTQWSYTDSGGQQRLAVSNFGGTVSGFNGVLQLFNTFSSGTLNLGAGNVGNMLTIRSTGGLDVHDPGTRPTCNSTIRGTHWVEEGGAGVKDVVSVCAKDASDVYGWRDYY